MKPQDPPLATGSPIDRRPFVPYAAISVPCAAASALFALQSQADASIIYSGVQNHTISLEPGGASDNGVINTFGSTVMGWQLVHHQTAPGKFLGAVRVAFDTSYGRMLHNASGQLKELAAGAAISAPLFPGHSTSGFAHGLLRQIRNGAVTAGTWSSVQKGFAAFRLNNGDLGWVGLEWTSSAPYQPDPTSIEITDWAYNSVPGQPIQAGQTGSVPEPGATALLALAGAGAAFLRRKRAAN